MAFDAHKNLIYSTVATAPSPASSGTSMTLASGDGASLPAVPFNATVWPAGTNPTRLNAEIVRVTNVSGDVLTITRTQESSNSRSIVVGDQFAPTITVKTLTDVEDAISNETSARVAKDDVLSAAIDVVSNAVSNETSARIAKDNTLSNQISVNLSAVMNASAAGSLAEISNRISADNVLSAHIDTVSNQASVLGYGVWQLSNNDAVSMVPGHVVYLGTSTSTAKLFSTVGGFFPFGLAIATLAVSATGAFQTEGQIALTSAQMKSILNGVSAMTPGDRMFATASGQWTSTPNAWPIGYAVGTRTLRVDIAPIPDLQTSLNVVSNQVSINFSAIVNASATGSLAEISNRVSADNALSVRIDTVSNADSVHFSAVVNASTAGSLAAISLMQSAINTVSNQVSVNLSAVNNASTAGSLAEASNRISADNALSVKIDTVSNSDSVHFSAVTNASTAGSLAAISLMQSAINTVSNQVSVNLSAVLGASTAGSIAAISQVMSYVCAVSARSTGNVSTRGLQSIINALSNRISGVTGGSGSVTSNEASALGYGIVQLSNNDAVSIVPGHVVYLGTSTSTAKLFSIVGGFFPFGLATATLAVSAVGAFQTRGIMALTSGQMKSILNGVSAMTPGDRMFATASGQWTSTPNAWPIGYAVSTRALDIRIAPVPDLQTSLNVVSNQVSVNFSAIVNASAAGSLAEISNRISADNALSVKIDTVSNSDSVHFSAVTNASTAGSLAAISLMQSAINTVSNQVSVNLSAVLGASTAGSIAALSQMMSYVCAVSARSTNNTSTRGLQSLVNALSNRISAVTGGNGSVTSTEVSLAANGIWQLSNNDAVSMVPGHVVYLGTSASTAKLFSTVGGFFPFGLATVTLAVSATGSFQTRGQLALTSVQMKSILNGVSAMTPGDRMFATASGQWTSTANAWPIGYALSTRTLDIRIAPIPDLQTSLNVVSNQVSVNLSAVVNASTTGSLAEASNRVSADNALSVRIDTVSNQVSVNLSAVVNASTAGSLAEASNRISADNALSVKIDTVSNQVSVNLSAVVNASTAGSLAAISLMQSAINTVSNQVSVNLSAVLGASTAGSLAEVSNRISADNALSVKIDTVSNADSVHFSAVVNASTAGSLAAISLMQSAINTVSGGMVQLSNNDAVSMVPGHVVYLGTSASTAKLFSIVGGFFPFGLATVTLAVSAVGAIQTQGLIALTSGQMKSILNGVSAMTPGDRMFATASGQWTSTPNAWPIGFAISTRTLKIAIAPIPDLQTSLNVVSNQVSVNLSAVVNASTAGSLAAISLMQSAINTVSNQVSVNLSAVNNASTAGSLAEVSNRISADNALSVRIDTVSNSDSVHFSAVTNASTAGSLAAISLMQSAINTVSNQVSVNLSAVLGASTAGSLAEVSNRISADNALSVRIDTVSNADSVHFSAVINASTTGSLAAISLMQSAINTVSGGMVQLSNNDAVSMVPGHVVYLGTSASTAKLFSIVGGFFPFGLATVTLAVSAVGAIQTQGLMALTSGQMKSILNGVSAMTPGDRMFATASGQWTSTPNAWPIGYAISTRTLNIRIAPIPDLQTSLNVVSNQVSVNLSAVVNASTAGSLAAISLMQSAINTVSNQVSVNLSAVNNASTAGSLAEVSNRISADNALSVRIDTVSNADSVTRSAYANASTAGSIAAISLMQSAINTVSNQVSINLSAVNNASTTGSMAEISNRVSADNALSVKIDTVSNADSVHFSAVVNASTAGSLAAISIALGMWQLSNNDAVSMVPGHVIYLGTSASTAKLFSIVGGFFPFGLATTTLAVSAIGAIQTRGLINLTSGQMKSILNGVSAMTPGDRMFATASGQWTSTANAWPIGYAVSTRTLDIRIAPVPDLQTSLNTVSNQVSVNLSAMVNASTTGSLAAISLMQSAINTVSNQVSVNLSAVNNASTAGSLAEVSNRISADNALSVKIDTVSNQVSVNLSAVLGASTTGSLAAISLMQSAINTVSGGMVQLSNNDAASMVPGHVVYLGTSASTAKLFSIVGGFFPFGLATVTLAVSAVGAVQTRGQMALTSGQMKSILNGVSAMTPGDRMFATASGQWTSTPNAWPIGYALSTRTLMIDIAPVPDLQTSLNVVSNQVSVNLSAVVNASTAGSLAAISLMQSAINTVSNQVSVNLSAVLGASTAGSIAALSQVMSYICAVSARSTGNVSTRGLQSIVNALSNRISAATGGTGSVTSTKVSDLRSAVVNASTAGSLAAISLFNAVSARSVGGISTKGLQSVVNALSNRISAVIAGATSVTSTEVSVAAFGVWQLSNNDAVSMVPGHVVYLGTSTSTAKLFSIVGGFIPFGVATTTLAVSAVGAFQTQGMLVLTSGQMKSILNGVSAMTPGDRMFATASGQWTSTANAWPIGQAVGTRAIKIQIGGGVLDTQNTSARVSSGGTVSVRGVQSAVNAISGQISDAISAGQATYSAVINASTAGSLAAISLMAAVSARDFNGVSVKGMQSAINFVSYRAAAVGNFAFLSNNDAASLVPGHVVYLGTSTSTAKLFSTVGGFFPFGLATATLAVSTTGAIQTNGPIALTSGQMKSILNGVSAMTPGDRMFATASGQWTSTANAWPIGYALGTRTLQIDITPIPDLQTSLNVVSNQVSVNLSAVVNASTTGSLAAISLMQSAINTVSNLVSVNLSAVLGASTAGSLAEVSNRISADNALSVKIDTVSNADSVHFSAVINASTTGSLAAISLMQAAINTVSNQVSVNLSAVNGASTVGSIAALSLAILNDASVSAAITNNVNSILSAGYGLGQVRVVTTGTQGLSGTGFAKISGLSISLAANAWYHIQGRVQYTLSNVIGTAFGFVYPGANQVSVGSYMQMDCLTTIMAAGPTGSIYTSATFPIGNVVAANMSTAASTNISLTGISGTVQQLHIDGMVNVTSAGVMELQAKQSATGGGVFILPGSYIRAYKLT